MKQTLLFLFLIVSFGVSSQIAFKKDSIQVDFDASVVFNDEQHLDIANSTADDVDFVWTIEEVSGPDEWEAYICDFNKCYGPGTYSVDLANTLLGSETKAIQFHLLTSGVKGSGKFIIRLVNPNDDSDILTSVVINYNGTLVDVSEYEINKLKIYPNPVTNYFKLDNPSGIASKMVIYDVLGKKVKSFDVSNQQDLYIGDISNGRYFARVFDNDGKSLKVLRIVKSSMRP